MAPMTAEQAFTDGAVPGPVEVVGAGLLGTSIALACRRAGLEVLLSDVSEEHLRTATGLGAGRRRAVMLANGRMDGPRWPLSGGRICFSFGHAHVGMILLSRCAQKAPHPIGSGAPAQP